MGRPWYAHFMADYERKTSHLSMLEHGAYRLLLDHYYATARALSPELERLFRVCRAVTKAEKAAVSKILNEFFTLDDDGFHNERADEEIAEAEKLSAEKSAAGKLGGIAARGKSGRKRNGKRMAGEIAEPIANELQKNTPSPSPSPSQEKEDDDDARARNILTRVCEILHVELRANPERLTWDRQIREMLRDKIPELDIIRGAEEARKRGIVRLQYVRECALSPPKTAGPVRATSDEIGERLKAKWAKEDEQTGRLRGDAETDAGGVLAAVARRSG